MRVPRRAPDRPPRGAAGSSTFSAVPYLSAGASPADWRWRWYAVVRDGGRGWSLSDRDVPGAAEWCAGQRRFLASVWRNSGAGCGDEPGSEGPPAERHVGTNTTLPWE